MNHVSEIMSNLKMSPIFILSGLLRLLILILQEAPKMSGSAVSRAGNQIVKTDLPL